jgi:hypothetical protein
VTTENTDLTAELKRGLSFVQQEKKSGPVPKTEKPEKQKRR